MVTSPSPPRLNPDEYLAMERASDEKHEYVDGQVIAMVGASIPHNIITENLSIEVGTAIRGSGCRSLSRDIKVRTLQRRRYYYPDLVIVCGRMETEANDVLLNPGAVFEVVSPSSEGRDRGEKFHAYFTIPSVKEYVLVEQDTPRIEVISPEADGTWRLQVLHGLDQTLVLSSGGVRISLARIYDGVEFKDSGAL